MNDTFRKEYKPLDDGQKQLMLDIKDKAEELHDLLELVGGREGSVAKTQLETAIMWAVKGVTS